MVANETVYTTKGFSSIIRWVDPSINIDAYIIQRTLSVGGNTAVPGNVMGADGETQGYVDVSAEGDLGFLGVFLNEKIITDGYDIDEAAVDGITVDILRPTGGRTIVSMILASHASAFAIEEGDYLRVGDTAGQIESFVYADTADSTDTEEIVVGRSATDHTTDATGDQVIYVWY